jgi:hypothetical protein
MADTKSLKSRKILKYLPWPIGSSRYHRFVTVVWAILLYPTLMWWDQSILWLAIMSWYANFSTEWSLAKAAKLKEKADE